MSKDIRSFFTVISKKSGSDSKPSVAAPTPKKRAKRIVDSDDDDVIPDTPPVRKRKKEQVISSDSEDDKIKESKVKVAKQCTPKLKPVNISDVFKKTPIKQSKVEFIPKSEEKKKEKVVKQSNSKKLKKELEVGIHDDDDFEKTLKQLDDDDIFESNLDALLETAQQAMEQNCDKDKENDHNKEETIEDKSHKKEHKYEDKPHNKGGKSENKQQNSKEKIEEVPSTTERKRSRTDSSGDKITPSKKSKMEHSDSGIDPGQESHEKKRYSAMLYQKYLHRTGPKHLGEKELPEGKADCLRNLCFLRTGVLDSLDSEAFDGLIKKHGGRTVHAVSKKVNYVVVGEDAGPAKLAKADSYNIPQISEDELLDLILTKSGKQAKYSKKDTSLSSEDLEIQSYKNSKASDDLGNEIDKIIEETKTKTKKENGGPSTKLDFKKLTERNKTALETEDHKKTETKSEKKDEMVKVSKEENKEAPKASTSKASEAVKPQKISPLKEIQIDPTNLSLTEKYKPKDLKAIIGQQGDGSNLQKLKHWLINWHKNQDPKIRKTFQRPSPWAKNDDGAYFKCALLSGPPGVGKTTTATLLANELGLDVVEFNASDTRSKRLLHEEVSQLLSTKTIAGFATGRSDINKKRVLLMDEVDGMAGNADRGGMQELIQLIKGSSVPIICMCNDRNHQKMRSLVNYCFDLKFNKPRLEQIRGAMMSVCFKEGIKIPPNALSEIIQGTGCDVRQTLNHLSVWAASGNKSITVEDAEREAKSSKKDTVMGPWEVCRAVFTNSEHKNMSLADRSRLFFYDYSFGPLFVQENYLKVQPSGKNAKQALLQAARAADSISMADLVDSKIRRTNNWSLLESEAFYASVFPGYFMSGQFVSQINFPGWLGKNSKKNKFNRILSEIQAHTRTSASASKQAVRLDYLVPLRNAILIPLVKKGMDGIDKAVEVMKNYNLLREDVDSIVELCQWAKGANPMSNIESKVKSAFTRTYNKQVTLLPYAPTTGVSKKKVTATQDLDLLGEEEEVESDQDDDDISKNTMIKVKKKHGATKSKSKGSDEAGSSKKGESKNKGKGKKSK